ncbi:hypothetical protein HYW43_01865 [Candidatus Daviesbacteria bacterium]|nr:hypothetical protein [Candidatus Daviesbacteria bacterium]
MVVETGQGRNHFIVGTLETGQRYCGYHPTRGVLVATLQAIEGDRVCFEAEGAQLRFRQPLRFSQPLTRLTQFGKMDRYEVVQKFPPRDTAGGPVRPLLLGELREGDTYSLSFSNRRAEVSFKIPEAIYTGISMGVLKFQGQWESLTIEGGSFMNVKEPICLPVQVGRLALEPGAPGLTVYQSQPT